MVHEIVKKNHAKENPKLKPLKEIALNLYKAGFTQTKYDDFLTDKVTKETYFYDNYKVNKPYHYKDLNNEEIEYLKKNFKRIVTHFENVKAKKYEDILFMKKQKKNYNEKKNALIHESELNKQDEMKNLTGNPKAIHSWSNIYNLINQYNKVVPNAYSKESLRNVVFGKDIPDNKLNGWEKSTYTIYIDKATKEKYLEKVEGIKLQENVNPCWVRSNL